jgi:hypothetical protein
MAHSRARARAIRRALGSARVRPGYGAFHLHLPALDDMVGARGKYLVNALWVLERNKGKATAATRVCVNHNHRICNRSKGLEMVAELLTCEVRGEASDEDLLGPYLWVVSNAAIGG